MNALHKPTPRTEVPPNHHSGFTLIGLVTVLGASAVLVLLLLPGLARSKSQAQDARCLNNMRQLMLAALLYADNNEGIWFPNQPGQDAWVDANMEWRDPGPPYSSTNTQCLTALYGSTFYEDYGDCSFFAPYIKDPSVYKCPADPSTADGGAPRIRTYSANQAVGTCFNDTGAVACPGAPGMGGRAGGPVTGQWLSGTLSDCQDYGNVFQKVSQMNRPNPVNLYVFVEEHPDTINDSTLAVQIAHVGTGGFYLDFPSDLHNGAGVFSFADGHAIIHKWAGPLVGKAPFIQGGIGSFPTSSVANSADVTDLTWLQSHASSPIDPTIAFPAPQN
jgi:prepilin-type processing-associated H-X9-DG protein